MAPEVLKCPTKKTPDENKENPQSAHYHLAVDAWAVGVFAYELVVGTPPFKAAQMIDTARNIIHAPVQFPESVSEMARDFILQALQKHAGDRPTVIEMLHHPWITMYQRRSSVRAVYTRSNSLMELVMNQNGNPLTGGADGDAGATSHQSLGREAGGSGQGQAYRSAPVASGVKDDDRQRMQNGLRAGNSKLSRMAN